MGIFSADTIYKHMRDAHGTIHDDDPVGEHANVLPQRQHWLLQRDEIIPRLADWQRDEIMAEAEQERIERRNREARAAARREEIARLQEVARRQEMAARQMADAARERERQRNMHIYDEASGNREALVGNREKRTGGAIGLELHHHVTYVLTTCTSNRE
jgi:hypothetical protein